MNALTTAARGDRWDVLARLYDEALAQPEPDRDAFVRAQCADEDLRREVLSLLSAADGESNQVDRLLAQWRTAPEGADETPVADRRVGPYRLVREIGRGGMGVVYLADRADGQYERRVAMKVTTASLFDAAVHDRFRAERDILAGLTHPHIATLFDGGVTPEGHPYFTMEYVEGRPIDAHCDARMLDVRARVRLFLNVCAAVSAAHRALIVHRDLKPSNVLVTRDGVVKLLDFGIAKLLTPLRDLSHDETVTGARLLTPAYASPEQVAGARISTATDVYALGLLLHELLSGRRAHRLQGRLAAEVERVVLQEDPLTLCQAARVPEKEGAISIEAIAYARCTTPARLCRSLNGDLARIVRMALRKEPERRYESVSLLADDLERYLDGRPVRARGHSAVYRTRKFAMRHRLALTAATACLAGLIGYAALTTQHAREMAAAAAREQLESAAARETADFVVGMFAAGDPDVAQGRDVTATEILRGGLQRVDQLSSQPALQARLLNTIGLVHFSLGRYDEAGQLARRGLDAARIAFGDDHPEVGRAYQLLGRALVNAGEPRNAIDPLRRALGVHQRTTGSGSAESATDMHELGYALARSGVVDEGERFETASLAARRALFGASHVDVAMSLSGLAFIRNEQARPKEAAALYRDALAIRIERLGERHPDTARARQNLAVILTTLGEYDAAEQEIRQTLETYRAVYGHEHPSIAATLNNLAILEFQRGAYGRAAELSRESWAMRVRLIGADHPMTQRTRANLAAHVSRLGRFAEAELIFRELLANWKDTPSARANAMANLADTLLQLRKLREAEAVAREALAMRLAANEALGEASCLTVLGRILTARGRGGEARDAFQRALEIRTQRLGAGHPSTLKVREYLAAAPKESNRSPAAVAAASSPR